MKHNQKTSPEFNAKKFQENFNRLMFVHKTSKRELHRHTGIPTSTIQRISTEENPNPTITTLKPLAHFFHITLNQLIGDEPLPKEISHSTHYAKSTAWTEIPIISWEEAIHWSSKKIETENLPHISTDIHVGEKAFALKIQNTELAGFQKGAVLIIDPDVKPTDHCFVVTYKEGAEKASLQKYLIYHDGTYFQSLNKIFKTLETREAKDIKILGTVIQLRLDASP